MSLGDFNYSGHVEPFPEDCWKASGHFRPDYRAGITPVPKNFQSLSPREKSAIIAERGKYTTSLVGTFYQYLAREFLRGDTLHEGKGRQYMKAPNGEDYEYLPDIVRSIGGRGKNKISEEHVEVKTCHTRSKVLAPPDQTAKYAATLYEGQFEGSPVRTINSVFFRYYPRQNGQVFRKSKTSTKIYRNPRLLPLGEFTGYQLTEYLANNTLDCVIMPLNLYIMLTRTGNEQVSGSDKRDYDEMHSVPPYFVKDLSIYSGIHTGLAKANLSLEDLLAVDRLTFAKNAKRFGLSPNEPLIDLQLHRLHVRKFELPIDFCAVHGDSAYPVNPFTITEYYLPDKENVRWLRHLRRNFSVIMKQSGLTDFTEKTEIEPSAVVVESSPKKVEDDVPF